MFDFSRALYLGKSSVITSNITAGSNIPGLTIDAASVPRIFDAVRTVGSRLSLQVKVTFPGTAPSSPSVTVRLQGAPAQTEQEARTSDLWATIQESTPITSQGVNYSATQGPVPRWLRVVSGGITATTWNGGVVIEVWVVGTA